MKAAYNDFLTENPNCSGFAANQDAIEIFDLLSKDESIIAMIEASEAGKPALSACVLEIESLIKSKSAPTVDLSDEFTRTVVGRMVKTVLSPFGYRPLKQRQQKPLSRSLKAEFFVTASCYSLTAPAVMRVVKRIEEVL